MIKLNTFYYYTAFFATILFTACNNEPTEVKVQPVTKTVEKKIATPTFNQDSAYAFIQAQVDFGPRIPGSSAHAKCADYLTSKLKSYNFEVIVQKATLKTFDKKQFILKNIIGSFKPELQSRVLICSHWDTRPWADSDEENKTKPFDGANDGASGVGVGLEMARQINAYNPSIGVDFIFFDLEDYGETNGEDESSWCLGSQYWAKNLHVPNYYANFGVLLDMVGGPNAIFPKEGNSVNLARAAVDKVWSTANTIGYGNYFSPQRRDFVGVDDHIYVNQAGIPCVDIIEYNQATGGFGSYHHTQKDNMDGIDKNTLKAVGQTLLEVIYNEK
ncbi:MAG: M28 family peptidase [Bacteroidia bacterium]